MLDVKKLLAKLLATQIKTKRLSGNTNAGGNFLVGNNVYVVSAIASGTLNRMFIPFRQGNTVFLKVLDWNSNAYTPVANGAVIVDIAYIDIVGG